MEPTTYTTDVVMVDGTTIHTTVTTSGAAVESFLREISNNQRQLFVGFDTEWRDAVNSRGRPCQTTAVLQLCVGRRCLVFQICRADYVPEAALRDFFACPDHRFAGVSVHYDVERMAEDYGMAVANPVELTTFAAEMLQRPDLGSFGLKDLTYKVMGVRIKKPRRVTCSKWDAPSLSTEQVDYACIDAYVSYEIGRIALLAGQ
ncbi:hypothetical protein EJB05_17570, partial [Eragrostis curvula]